MNQILDIKRLGYLARRDIIIEWRGIAIASGIVAGVMFLRMIQKELVNDSIAIDYNPYLIGTLVIWGCIRASVAFNSLHDKSKNDVYLLLPSSSLEKTLTSLLLVSLATPLYIMLLLSMTSVFTAGITSVFFHTSFSPLNPFQSVFFRAWGYVVLLQSFFFLGSAWFKKVHFIKTVLALILLAIAIGIISVVIFRAFFSSHFRDFQELGIFQTQIGNPIPFSLLCGLLAATCWFIAWLRVSETQSSDGI